jgi:hypothetical protein
MAQPSIIQGNVAFAGSVTFPGGMVPPSGSVQDSSINAGSTGATPNLIQNTKMWQQYPLKWSQVGTAATARQVVHVGYGFNGTVLGFAVGCVGVPVGAATVTVDLYKNGSSILSSILTINNSATAYVLIVAALAAGKAYVASDVFEVVVTATASGGTLPTEVFATGAVAEQPY